jgi:hypothetical protein
LLLKLIKSYFITFRNQPIDIKIAFVFFLAGAFYTLCFMLLYFFSGKMDTTQAISGTIICSLSAYSLLNLADHSNNAHISQPIKLFLSFLFGIVTIAIVMPLLCFLLKGIFYN